MNYTCLDTNNPSRLRGLKVPQDVLSNVRLSTVPGEIFTVPQQSGWTKPMAVYTMYFDVDGRTKRAFICVPYNCTGRPNHVVVGWPGSDGNPSSNGAMTMINPYNGFGNTNAWFANLVMAKDCIGLAIDAPLFGYNPHSNPPGDPHKPMLDDLCAVLAYQQAVVAFAATMTFPVTPTKMILAGYSYGAIRAQHCASLVSTVTAATVDGVYVASGQLDKRIDPRPEFNPGEWSYDGGYNYANMAVTYPGKVRFSMGGSSDYMLNTSIAVTPNINTTLNNIVALSPAKFSRYDHTGGHVAVYSDIKSFCDSLWP